jgi:HK97 family phage prohead protease
MDTKALGVVDVAVKATDAEGNGEFEAILSAPTRDRDGEVIDPKAFEPLPESIVIHTDHVFGVSTAVARAVPYYEGDLLKAKGYFGSDATSQAVRQKLLDGIITTMSVGFMNAKRTVKDGVPHITSGELLEASFVSVPSNREAQVLAAKSLAVDSPASGGRDYKVLSGSYEERSEALRGAIQDAHPESWWVTILATFDDSVVYRLDDDATYQASYDFSDGTVSLDAGVPVEIAEVLTPATSDSTDPEKAAAPAAASPADVAIRTAVARAEADALSVL